MTDDHVSAEIRVDALDLAPEDLADLVALVEEAAAAHKATVTVNRY
ncbi:hypothetical protein [Streptomyces sp. NPDC088847]